MTEPERLYTLAEARKLLGRAHCAAEGHDLETGIRMRNANGLIEAWGCRNCDVKVELTYPD